MEHERASIVGPGTDRQNLSYAYDNAGNVLSLTDGVNSGQKQCFQYDWLDRLTAAFTGNADCTAYSGTGAGPYNHTYAYDSIGNITNFAGSTGTMPDTEANRATFGRPKARRDQAAFPQVRLMGLLALAQRRLLAVTFAPYSGKGTGERALMQDILAGLVCRSWLFLLDAGLYAFDLIRYITQKEGEFIVKVPSQVKFKLTERLPDGSWLA